jgi:arginine decarboxylase-like protein
MLKETPLFVVELKFCCGDRSTEEYKQKFQEVFPVSHTQHRKAVRQLIYKYNESGAVADAPKSCGL